MKKVVFVILALTVIISLSACGKKEQPIEQVQSPVTMESLAALNAPAPAVPEAGPAQVQSGIPQQMSAPNIGSLPPGGPYKPTAKEVQTALKNAGYYTGKVDGKIGPMTQKGIEEFQKVNGLKADGKIGSKTWEALSAYLALQAEPAQKQR